jgi:hypothetical protein
LERGAPWRSSNVSPPSYLVSAAAIESIFEAHTPLPNRLTTVADFADAATEFFAQADTTAEIATVAVVEGGATEAAAEAKAEAEAAAKIHTNRLSRELLLAEDSYLSALKSCADMLDELTNAGAHLQLTARLNPNSAPGTRRRDTAHATPPRRLGRGAAGVADAFGGPHHLPHKVSKKCAEESCKR